MLDAVSLAGLDFLAARYGIPVQNLAGVVYICVRAGLGISLAFFACRGDLVLAGEDDKKFKNHETIRGFRKRWVSSHIIKCDFPTGELITSHVTGLYLIYRPIVYLDFEDNLYLRLFQFAHSCGGTSLPSVAIIEFLIIVAILLIVSMLTRRVARSTNGLDTVFAQDEDSKYARRWGSLYIKLKREKILVLHITIFLGDHPKCVHYIYTGNDAIEYYSYWLTESLAAAGGPNSDTFDWPRVVDILGCVNVIVVQICSKSPIFKRPSGTAGVNAVNIIESGYRLVSKGLLSTFLTELMLEVSL